MINVLWVYEFKHSNWSHYLPIFNIYIETDPKQQNLIHIIFIKLKSLKRKSYFKIQWMCFILFFSNWLGQNVTCCLHPHTAWLKSHCKMVAEISAEIEGGNGMFARVSRAYHVSTGAWMLFSFHFCKKMLLLHYTLHASHDEIQQNICRVYCCKCVLPMTHAHAQLIEMDVRSRIFWH